MTEKKQKVLAREYFKNCPLFKVDILSGIESSATSSNVEYRLTCKKCHDVFTRKGNSRKLTTCAGCKREWNRDNNTIVEGGKKEEPVKKGKKKPVSESSEEEEPIVRKGRKKPVLETSDDEVVEESEEEPIVKKGRKKPVLEESEEEPVVNESPPHDIDILAKILTGEIKPKASQNKPKKLKNDIEEILDYYDDYEDDRWYRFYYVKHCNNDNNTFIRADKFTDDKIVKEYENGLSTAERFRNVFPNPKISKRTGKEKIGHRTKEDVEKAFKGDEVVREKVQVEIVYMKVGERYFDLKTQTLFLLEGDKANDKIAITLI